MSGSFRGIFTPVITPIGSDEAPDLDSLRCLVDWQTENGVHGIWAMGTTSEFAGFDEDERASVVSATVTAARGRVPIIANVSDVSTRLTVRHGKHALRAGADAIAATPPYYYPHSQDELLTHYRAIREAVDLPLFIYNIPQTVKVKLDQATARILAEERTVAGIKDSQNDFEWFRQLTGYLEAKEISFASFAGTRPLIDAAIICGAVGAIPSMANAFPDLCVAIYSAASSGDFATSATLESRLIRLEGLSALMKEGSRNAAIIGLNKAVLYDRGVIASPALTKPLRTPSDEECRLMLEGVAELLAVPAS